MPAVSSAPNETAGADGDQSSCRTRSLDRIFRYRLGVTRVGDFIQRANSHVTLHGGGAPSATGCSGSAVVVIVATSSSSAFRHGQLPQFTFRLRLRRFSFLPLAGERITRSTRDSGSVTCAAFGIMPRACAGLRFASRSSRGLRGRSVSRKTVPRKRGCPSRNSLCRPDVRRVAWECSQRTCQKGGHR